MIIWSDRWIIFFVSVEPKTGHNLSELCITHQNCEINFCEED